MNALSLLQPVILTPIAIIASVLILVNVSKVILEMAKQIALVTIF
jgi:hypothetical protein